MPTETYNPQRAGTRRRPVVWKTGGSLSGVVICALVMVFIKPLTGLAVACWRLLSGEELEYFVGREGEKY